MTYNVLMGTLNPTHSLTLSMCVCMCVYMCVCMCVCVCVCVCAGCLMLIAWMMCASTALLLSKYYKRMWPNDKLCGTDVWFAVSLSLSLSLSLSRSLSHSLCLFARQVNSG